MDNAEEILQALEEFSKLKPKDIPKELDEYLGYVAKTGDPVYQWQLVKYLFHEKLANVIKDFYETSPTMDLPPCPNVDPFNYERLKTSLLERLDTFSSAPFTVQRICELLTNPKKQYNRVDKFMRAIEKNILVVSTREPGIGKRLENDQTETVLNGVPDKKVNKLSYNRFNKVLTADAGVMITFLDHVETDANSCGIQEEIEIDNSVPASTTVIATKTGLLSETYKNKDSDQDIKAEVVNDAQINVILLTENEMKNAEKSESDNIMCNQPINSSTPDSPESPDPSTSDDACTSDKSLSDKPVQPETSENKDDCSDIKGDEDGDTSEIISEPSKTADNISGNEDDTVEGLSVSESSSEESVRISTEESNSSKVEEQVVEHDVNTEPGSPEHIVNTEPGSPEHIVNTEPGSPEHNVNTEPGSPEHNVNTEPGSPEHYEKTEPLSPEDDLKTESLSPEDVKSESLSPEHDVNTEASSPDTSNESYQSSDVDSKNTNVDIKIEKSLEKDDTSNDSNSSSTEQNISHGNPCITTKSKIDIDDLSKTKNTHVLITVKKTDTEVNVQVEDTKKVDEASVSVVTCEETVAASGDSVPVREDAKEQIKETSTDIKQDTNVENANEILNDISDEQDRQEGSIIHVTPISSKPDILPSESQMSTSMAAVEDICVDQTSCSPEDEAMDVDESSNHQMITSECENESEPMDQSDVQMQS